jgi:hypothetical protein
MIRRFLFLSLIVTPLLFSQHTSQFRQFGNVNGITESQLHDYLSFIASDELEGRDTPSRGLNIAAKFIATLLSRWGYDPAGDSGSYFQTIDLLRTKVIPGESNLRINDTGFTFGRDFLAGGVSSSVSARLVFVRHGYVFYDKKIDPYKGISISGKIIVVLGGLPQGIRYGDLRGKEKGKEYETPATFAQKNGALGIIVVPSDLALRSWERTRKIAVDEGEKSMMAFKTGESPGIPIITLSKSTAQLLFEGERYSSLPFEDRDSLEKIPSFEFSEKKKVSFTVTTATDTLVTQNICAVLKGSDAQLKNEYVAFGAHYDHLGIGIPVNGDSIYNGADDDGSGTSALIALAEAFAKGARPKRSLLFVWHVGEEKGLWGSRYFTEHPTVPLDRIITQLNIDMIGRSNPEVDSAGTDAIFSGKKEIFVFGSNMMSSQLRVLSEDVNRSLLNLAFNYRFDDPKDPMRLFYRSDHYNYAKKGIPIIFYFDGLHEDYHKVTDEVDKIDFKKYCAVTKTVFATGLTLANLPHRPVIDHHAVTMDTAK